MQEKMNIWLKNNWFKVLAVIFLLGALRDNPYGYYQFLRWAILIISGYSAYSAYGSGRKIWAGIFGAIAILFNPVIPFYFSREAWQPIDVIVSIIFFISFINIHKKYEQR